MFNLLAAFIALTTLAAIGSLALALLAASRPWIPGARFLAATMAAATLWCAAYAGELSSPSLDSKVVWAKVAYLGIVCVPPSWLLFCLAQLGILRRRAPITVAFFYLLPAVTLLFVLLAVRVPLVWSAVRLAPSGGLSMLVVDHGLWFWVHTLYSYLCLGGGSLLLLFGVFRRVRALSAQGVVIVLAALLPWVANALTVFELVPIAHLDLTPPAFVASSLLIVIGLRRLRLLDVFPGMVNIARDRVVQEMQDGVLVLDASGIVLSANAGAATLFGVGQELLAGRALSELLAENGAAALTFSELVDGAERGTEIRLISDHGERRVLESVVSPLGTAAHPRGYVMVMRDVTERVATTQALKGSEERLRVLFEQSPVAIMVFDARLIVTECNERLAQLVGLSSEVLVGSQLTTDSVSSLLALGEAALRGQPSSFDGPFTSPAGDELWLQCEVSPLRGADGAVTGGICVAWDLTGAKRAEELIERLAFHDSLTELPNRTLFRDRLRQAIGATERSGRQVALGLLNLDRFKNVNDTLGHNAADQLLRDLAGRLGAVMRRADTLARVGGDEFAFILPNVSGASGAVAIGEKILAAVREPWQIGEHTFSATGSLGVAVYPGDAGDAEGLLENAERAVRRAKEAGGDRQEFYDLTMNLQAAERLKIEHDLRVALHEDQLVIFYQPQVDLASGAIVGVEALLRWQHPERGLVPPLEFIPIAEETGLIGPIGEWVLSSACEEVASWRQAPGPDLRLAVNVSPRQLHSPTLVAAVKAALLASGLPAQRLEIELTETAAISELEATCLVLGELRALGVGVALDDFGTGYASLSHLHQLPIDRVKIDRSFVSRVEEDEHAASIVTALVGLAHNLHLGTVAEGIETAGQLAFLQKLGCEQAQGYLFARPTPASECAALLGKGAAVASWTRQLAPVKGSG